MNRFLVLLFFIMIRSNTFAQPMQQGVVLSLDAIGANGLVAAFEYYKTHYSKKIYGITIMEDGSDVIIFFVITPPMPRSIYQRGGGDGAIKITYSKNSLKVIKASEVYAR